MGLVHNERIKLTANWLNAMASGVIITGVVAPAIAVVFGIASAVDGGIVLLSSTIWLLSGLALHFVARRVRRRLTP